MRDESSFQHKVPAGEILVWEGGSVFVIPNLGSLYCLFIIDLGAAYIDCANVPSVDFFSRRTLDASLNRDFYETCHGHSSN